MAFSSSLRLPGRSTQAWLAQGRSRPEHRISLSAREKWVWPRLAARMRRSLLQSPCLRWSTTRPWSARRRADSRCSARRSSTVSRVGPGYGPCLAGRRQKSESAAQAPRAKRPRRERLLRQPAHLRDTCPRAGDRSGLASVRAAPLGRLSFRGGADKRGPFRHISVLLLSLPLKHTQDGRRRQVGQKSGAPDGVRWGGTTSCRR